MSKNKLLGGRIFIISGPSGSGKTTLAGSILSDRGLKKRLVRSVSFTTRPKRSKETDKKDYFFISPRQFRQYRQAKKILEWTRYLGYYYGTPKDYLELELKKSRHAVLCLDLKGALKLKRLYPRNAVTIFVLPPSFGALTQRIRSRCHKTSAAEIKERLNLAKEEVLAADKYDYRVVNMNLKAAAGELKKIILKETAS